MPYAKCATVPPNDDIFYPTKKGRPSKNPPHEEFCKSCPVRLECLNYAVVHDEEGNWGGFTEAERSRLPQTFVLQLREQAKIEGWYEPLPDVDSLVRKYLQPQLSLVPELEPDFPEFPETPAAPVVQLPVVEDWIGELFG